MKLVTRKQAKTDRVTRYFTGIACKHGHVVERLVSNRQCITCAHIKLAAYKEANRPALLEKKRAAQKKYVACNPEIVKATIKATMAKNREARNAEKTAWARRNSGRVLAWTRQRQLAKVQRTPAWLTEDEHWMIEQAYELAALRTKMFGVAWHVDHVLPLRGKLVSGLHTPYNMQVILGVENSRKGNRVQHGQ